MTSPLPETTSSAIEPSSKPTATDSRYDSAVHALVTVVEQFIHLGAIADPAMFVRDVSQRLSARFPMSETRAVSATAARVTPTTSEVVGVDRPQSQGEKQ